MEEKTENVVLCFKYDAPHENWISYLPSGDSAGKVVILDRSQEVPEPNLEYCCAIEEKERYALARILSIANYPRIIIKADGGCILLEKPGETAIVHQSLEDALCTVPDMVYFFTIFRPENRKIVEQKRSDMREVLMDIKLSSPDEPVVKFQHSIHRARKQGLLQVSEELKNRL